MSDRPTSTIDRRELLSRLFPAPDEYLFISGLAGSARDAADLTGDGGFAPLMLSPIDFAALYQQRMTAAQEKAMSEKSEKGNEMDA